MNKTDLVNNLVEKGFRRADAEKAVGSVFEAMTTALAAGEKIQLVGFGSFEVVQRAERVGRNPRTNEEIRIPASKSPVFKAGKALKDAVNG